MTKKEAKRDRRRRKILLAIIMIMFTAVVLSASTYAWFTANRSVTVEKIDVTVSTSTGLQISVDAANWKSVVTNADIIGASWSGVANQLPTGTNVLAPVSTIGEIDITDGATKGFMKMFKGTIDSNTSGDNILIAERSTEAKGTSGDFVAFDLFFQSTVAQTVYLTSNSKVIAIGDSTGIENAARVALIRAGDVPSGSTAASAQAIKATTASPKLLWEPNYDVHTPTGVANALNVYGKTVGQTGAAKMAYNGVKAPIAKANAIELDSADTNYFGAVTTTGSLASGIPTNAYINAFDAAAGITKVRVYMWIEGQDVDCEDHASGGSLSYNLQFSIDSSQS